MLGELDWRSQLWSRQRQIPAGALTGVKAGDHLLNARVIKFLYPSLDNSFTWESCFREPECWLLQEGQEKGMLQQNVFSLGLHIVF